MPGVTGKGKGKDKEATVATATVVNAWQDGTYAYLAVVVSGDRTVGAGTVDAEYVGRTPLLDAQGQAKALATLKAELVAACKAARDQSRPQQQASLAVSGSVTL